jgi:hypothetical protein
METCLWGRQQTHGLRPHIAVTAEEASPLPKTPEGRGQTRAVSIEPCPGPTGGWGSLKSVSAILFREKVPPAGELALLQQNKPHGFMQAGNRRCRWKTQPNLLSEPKIITELAKAVIPPNPKVPWDEWVGDYGRLRDEMEESWPEMFKDFYKRLFTPGGLGRPLPARRRIWKTDTGRANFLTPDAPAGDPLARIHEGGDALRLSTVRSKRSVQYGRLRL